MLHHADSASDKLSIRRAKLRTYFQRQTLPPFEVKSINPQTSLKKWILVSIKADLSHSEKLPKQTYNHFYSQTYINNVREIHSTDINIFRNVKSTIPTILTCTLSQGCPIHWHPWAKKLKHFDQTKDFTCISIRHLAWILFDSSFIRESDLAMSSSGKWRQTNTNHHQQQKTTITKHKLTTNPQTCSCATYVSCMYCTSTFTTKSWSFQDTTQLHDANFF